MISLMPMSSAISPTDEAAAGLLNRSAQGVIFDGSAFAGETAIIGYHPEKILEGGWDEWTLL